MLKLPPDLLDQALATVDAHGYGDFFPEPPELTIIRTHWNDFRAFLADVDLDTYAGYDRINSFAPKSRLNIRRVSLLHPFDLILFNAVVLQLRDDVTNARLPAEDQRVFSYRGEGCDAHTLYTDAPSYSEFKNAVADRVATNREQFVGITDIADFYPRIYQHRLVNALQAAAGPAKQDYIRVLEKMLVRFADGASYGIPIGPPASRPLGEAVLIDVDSTLLSYDIDFVRFTDDFVIFGETPEDAEYGIRVLAETLYLNHGLTLQTAKTKVLRASDYLEQYLTPASEKEEARRNLLEMIGAYDEPVAYEDLNEEQKAEVDAMNLSEMLKDALGEGHNVDYKEVSFILGRLSALQKPELIPIVLDNLERLFPVAHSVAAFFKNFSQLDNETRDHVAKTLLRPVLEQNSKTSEYYCVWILNLFHHHQDWDNADNLLKIFRETHSDTIRRYAALALSTSGTRSQVLQLPKYLSSASSLTRSAILLATGRMGADERRHQRRALRLNDPLERLCAES